MGIDRNKDLYFLIYRVLHWLPIFTSREKIIMHCDEVGYWRYSSSKNYKGIDGLSEVNRFYGKFE